MPGIPGLLVASLAAVLPGAALHAVTPATTQQTAAPAAASPSGGKTPSKWDSMHARPRLIAETATAAPGATLHLGISFDIDPGWHLYWNGQNDSGNPIEVTAWRLPAGMEPGEILWPAPKRYEAGPDIFDHVYFNQVTLIVPVKVPADAKPGTELNFGASLDWLVCEEACVPGKADVSLKVPVAAGTPAPSVDASRFAAARAAVPAPLAGSGVTAALRDGALAVHAPGASRLEFFPGADAAEPADRSAVVAAGERMAVPFKPEPEAAKPVRGILHVVRGGRSTHLAIDLSTSSAPPGTKQVATPPKDAR